MATGILTLSLASDVTRAQCPQQSPDIVWQNTTPAGTCPTPSQCGTWGSQFYDLNISQNGQTLWEIAHSCLLPRGWSNGFDLEGWLLLWTRKNSWTEGPQSWLWDPQNPSMQPLCVPVQPAEDPGANPFCSGHVWLPDGTLLVIGTSAPSGSAFTFDPGDPNNPAEWRNFLSPLPAGFPRWYPTAVLYPDVTKPDGIVALVGGGTSASNGCATQQVPAPYQSWLTIDPFTGTSWTEHVQTPNYWHYYPRMVALSSGDVLSLAEVLACDVTNQPKTCNQPTPSPQWKPTTKALVIDTNTHTYYEYDDAGVQHRHYGNGVLMHRLKAAATFPADETEYDLNQIFATAGSNTEWWNCGNAIADTDQLVISDPVTQEPVNWSVTWTPRGNLNFSRVYSALVPLPDGKLLVLGGQQPVFFGGAQLPSDYRLVPELFDPATGLWTVLEESPFYDLLDQGQSKTNLRIPRGYHSTGILLPDASVCLLGGMNRPTIVKDDFTLSDDKAEFFFPPYLSRGTRPSLSIPANSVLRFGKGICAYTTDPSSIARAVLIGVPSQTHHFDYGMVYVELLVGPPTGSGGGYAWSCVDWNIHIQAPPVISKDPTGRQGIVPPGWYLLFLVDTQGRPSEGKFIFVDFPPAS